MAIYAMSQRTSNTTTANACWEIRTAATDRAYVMEIGITINAATASVFGLGRPAAIGVTPTSPQTFIAEDPGAPASTVVAALAWATGPTVPANFFRRISLPATIGSGVIWTFPRGLIIGISNSIILWNLSTVSVADVYAVIDD